MSSTERPINSDEGDRVQFPDTGGGPHDVTSTQFSGGERLFSSATIFSGTTAVDGTQSLSPGTYPLIRTVHAPGMAAELVVRESGAPPPGPCNARSVGWKTQELRKKVKFFATAYRRLHPDRDGQGDQGDDEAARGLTRRLRSRPSSSERR